MVPQWQTGIVKRIEQETHNTRRFWVELPETNPFTFKPGQFVTLDLPIHEQRNKRWRSYSIASIPDGGNLIELLIVYLPTGLASEYIFNEIKVGSTFTLRGPQGVFVLPEVPERDLYMICTGTGIAPFRSMLEYISKHNLPHKNIHLIFGTRTQADILYRDEMTALQVTLPGFKYHVTLSREEWDGNKGYVHDVYERLCADKPNALFMLCGWRAMIDEAKRRLVALGYDKRAILAELYG
ncbi:MAG: oxidoreductase [Flavipsychrobacter sp.]|jgi:CDP-4-dehydro-6-deoxyglucose reductase|nr:oxidoreductase [Flavipsychrobacter sp.]